LREQLLQELPSSFQGYVDDLLAIPQREWWPWADQVAQIRFLLTTVKNKVDGESLGASLYELGLVPDLHLFDDPALMQNRIHRNLESVRKLTYSDASIRGRVLELGLSDKVVQQRLITFLTEVGIVDPHVWTRQIIINKANTAISFDKWQFIDEINSDKIALKVVDLALQKVGEQEEDERLEDLSGQKVLNPNLQTKFNITFNVDPHPTRVPSLDHFTVQILTKDNEPVGGAKRVKAWTSKKAEQTVSLDKLNKLDFEDGWHFVRVLPWTKDDEPIPLDEPSRDFHDNRVRSNDSEPFYVLCEGEIVDPPPRAVPQASSFEHAKVHTQFKELIEQRDPALLKKIQVEWIDKASKNRHSQQETLEVRFEHGSRFHIPISRHLKTLEQAILTEPRGAMHWSWHVNMRATHNDGPVADSTPWPKSAAVESFLDARTRYFEAVCSSLPGKEPIIQSVDLIQVYNQSVEYAEAYQDLLTDFARKIEQSRGTDQQKTILALRTIIAMDTVRITLTDFRGRTKEAVLIGPTHPLRALWFTTWAKVAQQWLKATMDGSEEYIIPARDGLLHNIVPLNIPATLPNTDGRIFIMVDNINPFWSLYAPSMEENTRGLLGEICTLLGLPEPAIGGEMISVDSIVARIARYLVQHPYIRTLTINAFNPGRAEALAQALVHLQKQEAFSLLHYDVRLFVPDPAAPYVGEAIEDLLAPKSGVSTEAADIFSIPGNSHLFPKLSLAIHSLDDFYHKPQTYRAHLSMLFDLFPAEEVGAGPAFSALETMPLHGLIQDFTTRFRDSEAGTFWQRQPQHGQAHALPGTEESVELLASVSNMLSGMVATIATGNAAFELRPIITLSLTTAQRELIHYVHEVSDWVLTIDRNIGIEFFDHGWQDERPEYLIDYIPGSSAGSGYRLITTSRVLLELKSTLQPVLAKHLLTAGNRETSLILNQLRALSGRLALKLISSSTHQTEALGLALARLFLLQQGALSNQIILPLDTHLDLFYSAKRASEEIGEAVTLQRTDLALFDLDATTRTIRCNLVEVKCYSDVGSLSAYTQLKENIAEQLEKSQEVLQYHFDPHLKHPDRPDRLLKTRELAILLAFYLGRSQRYKLMRRDVDTEAQFFLATLEDGYTLHFTRSALIFDFEKMGTELVDTEHGIEFYRIGKDQIDALIADYSSQSFSEEMGKIPTTSSSSSLPSASFLAQERDHSVAWERKEYDDPDDQELLEDQTAIPQSHDQSPLVDNDMPANDVEDIPVRNADVLHHIPEQEGVVREESINCQDQDKHAQEGEQEQPVPYVKTPGEDVPGYDVMLGVQGTTPQYGIFGEIAGRKIALDLNQTHTISLFGVQGSGKSYTLGSIVEMACLPIPTINVLPSPLATVIFHYSPTQDYKPEFTSMIAPNSDANQLVQLRERYGATPQALQDMVLLVPAAKVAERQSEYPGIEVLPITFAAAELKAVHWKFLMNAVGSQSTYIKQINLIMKKLREKLTLDGLRQEIANSFMSDHLKELAQMRLEFAAEYIDDSRRLTDVIRPGRLVIVDIRDEFIEKDEALGLFVVLLQIFSEATYQGKTFNKLVVFDEAHKYIESPDLVSGLIEVVREMRHKGTSIMVASQDPPSVPVSLIELSSQIILHRCNSPAWLKHIQKANSSLNSLTPEKMSHLGSGEAYVWSAKATDDGFTRGAIKMKCRPRVTQHGGDTKTAVIKDE
jgi:DNA phosphorothioation-dependent restriction protein DptH